MNHIPGTRNLLALPPGDALLPALASSHQQTADTGLLEYWTLVRSHKYVVLVFVLTGLLAGVVSTLPQKPVFQASSRLEIQEPNDNFLNIRDFDPASRRATNESYIQTQMEVLSSPAVVDRVVQQFTADPHRPFLYNPDMLSLLLKQAGWDRSDGKPALRDVVKATAKSIGVRNLKNTNVVEITAESNDPLLAAEFANALADSFMRHDIESRLEAAQTTGRYLQAQIGELRRQLQASEKDVQQYAQGAGLLVTSQKGLVSEEKLRQVQQELSAAQAARMQAEARYRIAQASNPEALSDVLNDNTLRSYSLKLTDLRSQLTEQRAVLAPEHYKVKRLQSQIEELEQTFTRERDQIVKRIANDFAAAKLREEMLGESYARAASTVAGQGASMVDYNLLQREADTNRHVYEAMLQKVKEASVASAVRASTMRVINRATPSTRPVRPDTRRALLLGMTTGLFLAIVVIAARDKLDSRLREPGEVRGINVPELGVILSAERILPKEEDTRRALPPPASGNGGGESSPQATGVRELLTWTHKPSVEAESFRAVLTSLLTVSPQSRVVVFTSAVPREGKTTIISNLAVSLAEIDRRVLVIDADLREPRIHRVFDVQNSFGLSDIAQGRHSLRDRSIESLVKPTHVPNVFVLPSGPGSASVFRLLYSPRLEEFLERARAEFDMILIDTPPMLAIPDARILARKTDGVVLVMRSGYVTRATAQTALDRLMSDGIPIVGTILNDWKPKPDQYGYYSRYYAPQV
jgi:capsular exopolysaccharide synthesis family protein